MRLRAEGRHIEAVKEQWLLESYFDSYLRASPASRLASDELDELLIGAGSGIEAYPYRGGPAGLVSWVPRPALWLTTLLLATLLVAVAELIKLRR